MNRNLRLISKISRFHFPHSRYQKIYSLRSFSTNLDSEKEIINLKTKIEELEKTISKLETDKLYSINSVYKDVVFWAGFIGFTYIWFKH